MLDGSLLTTGNSLGTVPLHVLMTGAEPTPELDEPGFENEVQDIPGCRTRRVKINYPNLGFVQSWLCRKIFLGTGLLLNPPRTIVSAKNQRNLHSRAI